MEVRHKLKKFIYTSVYFYLGKNACSFKHTCIRCLSLCRSNQSYVFFVRSFGCALFYFEEENK